MENDPLPDSPQQPDLLILQAQYDSLHHLVVSMLLLMIVIAGTLWIFLMRQSRTTKADLEVVKPAWTNAMAQFQRTGPVIDETVKKFVEFAKTNADFSPVLAKYGVKPAGTTSAPAASKASAPVAPKK